MKKISLSFLLFALVAFFPSCEKVVGNGPLVQQEIYLSGFSKLIVAVQSNVRYTIGPAYKVEVIAQQNVIDVLRIERIGEDLTVKLKNGVWLKNNEDITINISAPDLKSVLVSGSATVNVTGDGNRENLDLNVSGSGKIEMQQAAISNKLSGTVSGSGSITVLSGTANQENLHISGSGSINLVGLQANKASTDISGSGTIRLKVAQTLDARISGSGIVYYLGSPAITSNVSGSGSVRAL